MTDGHHDDSAAPNAEIIPPHVTAAPVEPPSLPPHEPEPPPPPHAPRRGTAAVLWLGSLLVLILVLVGAAPYWAPALVPLLPWGAAASPPQLGPLEARLSAAETARRAAEDRIARLETALKEQAARPSGPADTTATTALAARLDAIEHRPAPAPQAAPDLAPLTDALQRATARLDAVETKLATAQTAQTAQTSQTAQQSADRALLIAVADLRAALAGSGPFAGELAAVATLASGDAEVEKALAPLKDAAAAGLPTASLLLARFTSETAPAIRRAGAAPTGEDADLGERVLARMRALVTIRRLDDQGRPDDPVATALAATREALLRGDVAGAAAKLKTLSGAPAQAAAPFLGIAEQRVAADATLGTLAQRVAARIAGEASR